MAPESRDEVRQRINSLYDQAENATGNYNATRAMSGGSRSRGVPLFKRPRRDDPGLDNIAREWFDGARSKLGPSVPAALPSDRQPARPGPRRPVSAMAADLLGQLEGSGPARLELTAGPSAQTDFEVVRELPPPRPEQRAVAALEAAPAAQPVPSAQPVPTAQTPWPTPEAQAAAQQWAAPPVGIPSQRTDSGSFRTDALAATRAIPAVTETGGIPIVSATDTGTFRIMTPGGTSASRATPPADPTGFRVMTPGGPGTGSFPGVPPMDAGPAPAQTMAPVAAPAPAPAPADMTGFRIMTPGGSGTTAFPGVSPLDMDTAPGQAAAPAVGDTGSFRIMTPGATGSFPMPTSADAGAFPTADPMSTGVFPTAAPTNSGAFPTAAPTDSGAFPTMAPAAAAPAPAPMDMGGFRVMSPNATAGYAEVPQAAADTAYATAAYATAAPATPAPMAPMQPAASYAAAPAPDMADAAYAYAGAMPPADTAYTYAGAMAPADAAYAYAGAMPPADAAYAYATAAMPTAMAAPPAAMPAPMAAPMQAPMQAPLAAPMQAPMQAPMAAPMAAPMQAPPIAATAAAPMAMAAPPEAMMMAAPAMAMATAAPVMTAPLPTTPLPTAPPQVAAPVPTVAAATPAPGVFVQPGAVAEPGKAMKALAFAREQIGRPCVWGATGPGAYDCSSLTQAAWRAAGVTLPRSAPEQTLAGTPMTLAAIEPGDLVFFFDDDSHVGIYAGGGTMVHAPSPGALIREESIYNAGESAIHRVIRPA
ncbi:NlpC/P60 family protein [Streptomyces sp. NPDC058464]|uniref:C40 family peptidase n=1 Tax=Streptomyces sp. NPDC058464 TaxID=3346511 RepID=UPI00366230ED